jgi:hypothetical protein
VILEHLGVAHLAEDAAQTNLMVMEFQKWYLEHRAAMDTIR